MEIFGGLFMGLIGSLHCLGMCGPLAIAIPSRNENKLTIVVDSLLYNIGRVFTYAVLGALVGILGTTISLAGYQEVISIIAGVALLIVVFIPKKWENSMSGIPIFKKSGDALKKGFGKILYRKTIGSMFLIGNLNGLLPCGLVYTALIAAIAPGTFYGSITFMFFFGLGTLPMMAGIFIMKSMVTPNLRKKARKLIPVGLTVVAVILILRGMALGIPFVSPVLPDKVEVKSGCCHSEE